MHCIEIVDIEQLVGELGGGMLVGTWGSPGSSLLSLSSHLSSLFPRQGQGGGLGVM